MSSNRIKEEKPPLEDDGVESNETLKTEVDEISATASVFVEPSILSIADQVAAADQSLTMASGYSKSNEPPAFMSERKSYAEYKSDLRMWSRITSVPKKNQAEVVVYNLDGHPSRIKEKIVLNIGDQIKDSDDGNAKLIEYLDKIYKVDDMADAWAKYKNFQRISRTDMVAINDFIAEFEEYILAKTAGCEYNDIILGFRLLEATRLTDMDEKFVLTGVDYDKAKTDKNLFEQIKSSLKKFQGRKVIGSEENMVFDPALVANVAQALLAQGWSQPKGRRRSTSDPGEFKPNPNKVKTNPRGRDGRILTCFKCNSTQHMKDKCPKMNKKKEDNENLQKETGLVAAAGGAPSLFGMIAKIDGHEIVMVINTEKELCLLVEEAGVRGVLDSACTRTVAGKNFVRNYVSKLPHDIQDAVSEGMPSKTNNVPIWWR